MSYIFLILMIALLSKDILPLGDRYVLRGTSEGLALAAGLFWLLQHRTGDFTRRYFLIISYLATLFLTALVSQRPFFVTFQAASLASVIIFFIAYIESTRLKPDIIDWNLKAVGSAFALVCMGSLILLAVRPQLTFEITPEGNRFKGVFSEPAMMGAVAGLLIGISALGKYHWSLRFAGILTGGPCLYLTGSRTSWGAAIAALLISGIIYIKHKRAGAIALVLIGVIGSLGFIIADFHIASDTQSKVIRSGSIGTLSGRTALWELALIKYQDSPVLGFGFTTGSDALASDMGDTLRTAFGVTDRSQQRAFSLHSGYIQSLMDSGAIGASLYVAIIAFSLWNLFRYDHQRRYGAVMYGLIFFSLSNVTDTIIFGAAVFYEVYYWYLSILSLSLVAVTHREFTQSSGNSADTRVADLSEQAKAISTSTKTRHFPLLQD